MVTKRDRAILDDLSRFRCLSRDDIVDLHFQGLRQATKACNMVMKRLRRDGYVDVSIQQQPYIYFPHPSPIKKDSQKIPHFLAIVDVYKQLLLFAKPREFIVEPKFGKGMCEPDVFVIWRGAPLFIEVQRSIYSSAVMDAKIKRYEAYFESREWEKETWQPADKKLFPRILILTDTRYDVSSDNFMVFQAQNIKTHLEHITPKNIGKPIKISL